MTGEEMNGFKENPDVPATIKSCKIMLRRHITA